MSLQLRGPITVNYSTDCYNPAIIIEEEMRHVMVYEESFEEVRQMVDELSRKKFQTQFACKNACGLLMVKAGNEFLSQWTHAFIDFTHPWRRCDGSPSFLPW